VTGQEPTMGRGRVGSRRGLRGHRCKRGGPRQTGRVGLGNRERSSARWAEPCARRRRVITTRAVRHGWSSSAIRRQWLLEHRRFRNLQAALANRVRGWFHLDALLGEARS
jgi:hypothetical protein